MERRQPQRPQAAANALQIFHRLQALATYPDPEVSWWLSDEDNGMLDIEQQYMRGFDWLLANDSGKAIADFEQVSVRLKPVEQSAGQVAQAVSETHDALYAIPHLLAWLLKEYQLASEQDKAILQDQLRDLGEIAEKTGQVYPYLTRAPGARLDAGLEPLIQSITAKLSQLRRSFAIYVDQKTNSKELGGAAVNSLTYRRGRIALLCPLLSNAARLQLHADTLNYLSMKVAPTLDKNEDRTPSLRSSKEACDEFFLKPIDSARERWAAIAKSDMRLEIEDHLGSETDAANVRPKGPCEELMKIEYWMRAGGCIRSCVIVARKIGKPKTQR
ncbi:MAG: hypothetical protein R3C53_18560 [Pirellulaceae bacterium]